MREGWRDANVKCSRRCWSDTERIVCTSRDVCMSDDNAIVIINGAHSPACGVYREKKAGRRGEDADESDLWLASMCLVGVCADEKKFFNKNSRLVEPRLTSPNISRYTRSTILFFTLFCEYSEYLSMKSYYLYFALTLRDFLSLRMAARSQQRHNLSYVKASIRVK